jgi:protocatechuate 3,4-dioxygenase beta subunit
VGDREARTGALRRRGVPLVLLAAALAGLWHVVRGEDSSGPETTSRAAVGGTAGSEERPLAPGLEGRDGAGEDGAARAGTPVVAPGVAGPPPATAIPALDPAAAAAGSFQALSPRAVKDGIAPGAAPPLCVERSDVVGRVGSYGVRDTTSVGAFRWFGVAQIERSDRAASEKAEDTEDPATTAVKGVVVGEDGAPIRGAEVILYSCFYLRQAYYDHRVRQIGRVVTGADGAFDVRPVSLDTVHFGADGEVLVTVRHPHYPDLVAQPLPAIVPGRESDVGRLVLPEKGVTLHGVVSDLEGRPVAGAVLRASGVLNPTEYDKTERMVVLDQCPAAVTDERGRYALSDFAPGDHEISIHVHIDCVLHVRDRWAGDREWSPRVLAGNAVRGRVVDPDGVPVAAAVVAGGDNWTPSNADGTFWLDNVRAGPLTVEVAHHDWHTVFVPGVATNGEEITVTMVRRLARVSLTVVDAAEAPVPLVAVDWTWPPGGGPGRFSPDSRYWRDARGVYALVVPEGAVGATVSDATGASFALAAEDLADGATPRAVLALPPGDR